MMFEKHLAQPYHAFTKNGYRIFLPELQLGMERLLKKAPHMRGFFIVLL